MFTFKRKKQERPLSANSLLSVAEIVDHHIPAYGGRTAIRFDNGSTYRAVGFTEYHRHIHAMIQYFKRVGAEQKVVATFCSNRLEWDMTILATFYTANILFPLDTHLQDEELRHLLRSNPPDFILAARGQLPRLRRTLSELALRTRILIADISNCYEDRRAPEPAPYEQEFSMQAILDAYNPTLTLAPSKLLSNKKTILGRFPTSGTGGLPKIAQISHASILAGTNDATDLMNLRAGEDLLSVGAYTHVGALMEFLVAKARGFSVTYFSREPDEPDVLENEIKKLKKLGVCIKALAAAPKVWIYLLKEWVEEIKNKPTMRSLYEYLVSIEINANFTAIRSLDRAKLSAARILLRNKLGGYLNYGISYSSKLDGALVELFGKFGITVIDNYVAAECCGIIARNGLNGMKAGTCGRPSSLLQYRLKDARSVVGIAKPVGLLEIKGLPLMHSYLGEEPGSRLSQDGFYNTGDLCWVDDDGFLHIVGNEKEILQWEDGTYINLQYLSNLIIRSIFVKDALVTRLRPQDNYLSVFIYPDYKRMEKDPHWKAEIESGIKQDRALRKRMESAIDYSAAMARVTAPINKKVIYILPRALQRTAAMKIKFIYELKQLHHAKPI